MFENIFVDEAITCQSRCSRLMDAVDDRVMDCIKKSCINIFDYSEKRKAIAFDKFLG